MKLTDNDITASQAEKEKSKELVGHSLALHMDASVTPIFESSRTSAEFIYVHFLILKHQLLDF